MEDSQKAFQIWGETEAVLGKKPLYASDRAQLLAAVPSNAYWTLDLKTGQYRLSRQGRPLTLLGAGVDGEIARWTDEGLHTPSGIIAGIASPSESTCGDQAG